MTDEKTIVTNLNILGSLQKGYKLFTRDKYFYHDSHHWITRVLIRNYYHEDRNLTCDSITKLLIDVQTLLDNYDKEGPKSLDIKNSDELKKYLLPILIQARIGLDNLSYTYKDDITIKSRLDVEKSVLFSIILRCNNGNPLPTTPITPNLTPSLSNSLSIPSNLNLPPPSDQIPIKQSSDQIPIKQSSTQSLELDESFKTPPISSISSNIPISSSIPIPNINTSGINNILGTSLNDENNKKNKKKNNHHNMSGVLD